MKNLDEAIAQIRKAFSQVLVKDIYSSPVVTIKQNSPFHVVEHMFRENRIKHLPVVDENNHLAGLITMADLHRIIPPKRDI
ncbi:MAG: CBS domain-containing protein, partial [Candidatus Omnitrophica bacterium]|nr:CBS domain-containing protein [Candidatus Omnitrophota bacterium]